MQTWERYRLCAFQGGGPCVWWEPQSRSPPLNVAQSVYGCLSLKCHVDSVYLYLDHSTRVRVCVCARAREWELPWWQPINSALGDSARRNSDSRAALVMQYGSTGIRELSYTLKVTLCVCVCVCACAHICCLPLLLSCHPSLTHGGPAWNSLMT